MMFQQICMNVCEKFINKDTVLQIFGYLHMLTHRMESFVRFFYIIIEKQVFKSNIILLI